MPCAGPPLTRDLPCQRAKHREALGALRDAHGAARVQQVERVAQLEQVVVGGDGQALGQQAASLPGSGWITYVGLVLKDRDADASASERR
jgi:hypothetical protein